MYTSHPVTGDSNQVCIKMVVGYEDSLTPSYIAGTPYKLTYDKSTKECSILSMSNYRNGIFSSEGDLTSSRKEMVERPIDYS